MLLDPLVRDERFRIEMTVGCRDSDPIPKVANAGQIDWERGEAVQIMHNGVKVVAGGYYGDWMSEIITRLRGHHEPQEELVFHEVLKHLSPFATMIELGGFWSYYSLWFLHHQEARRAIVVEPDANHIAIGRSNARLNQKKVEFVQACVGRESADEVAFAAEAAEQVRIPQVTVPQLISGFSIASLDLLHLDIQGGETDVIRSCLHHFTERRIRYCFVSTHAHQISGDPLTHQKCLALLRHAGGLILAEHDVHESFSGDGLIVAYFGEPLEGWNPPPLSRNRYSASLFPNPLFELAELRDKAAHAAQSEPAGQVGSHDANRNS